MIWSRFLALAILAVMMGLAGFASPPEQPMPVEPTPLNEVIQNFPSNDVMKTAWKVKWATAAGYGLTIDEAWFKRGPKEPWMQVLGDARLAEMFVPYHSGSPRFWDVSYNFSLVSLNKEAAGPFGKLLNNPPNVVHEVRDRGVMWVDTSTGVRRGQKMCLWACLDAANYRYVIEYGFQDDGTISFRVGSTGRNYSSREFEGHMHNGLWRVDVNLDGAKDNSVHVMEHLESADEPGKAKTVMRPFNKGVEGFEDWHADRFTMLNITNDKKKNARKMPISYDVVPLRMGNARHFGDGEACTQHDFWVTVNRKGEMYYPKVQEYVKKGEKIMSADVVLWHSSACHHEPRSEDGELRDGSMKGATPIAWSGFDLRPRNVFDRTPHFPY
jgi:Cu2+-containing amine oxidase